MRDRMKWIRKHGLKGVANVGHGGGGYGKARCVGVPASGDGCWASHVVIHWMVIRDCCCQGTGQIESDWDAGSYYPCCTCNPNWCRLPFDVTRQPRPPKLNTAGIF